MKITLLGRPISKKNSRRHFGNISYPSVAYVKYQKYALQQLLGVKPVKFERYGVRYIFYMKGKLDTDIDNMVAGINDILQDAGIISDDKLITHIMADKVAGCKDWSTDIEILED